MPKELIDPTKSIVLFDGVCNLCSGLVQFLLKKDKKDHFYFASLQSKTGRQLLKDYKVHPATDSIVLINGEEAFVKSDAAIKIAEKLGGFYKGFLALRIFPKSWRNFIYDKVAKNRYRFFGKKESCMIPDEPWKHRFIDIAE